MKTNPNDAAFARPCGQNEEKFNHGTPGLTKLEWFAGLALQGLSASTEGSFPSKNIAECSVRLAKALIDELNKEGNNE